MLHVAPVRAASLLDYEPDSSDFPAALSSYVTTFSADERYRSRIRSALQKLPRGYHDELQFLLGLSHERSEEFEPALAAFKESIALRTSNPVVLAHTGYALVRLERCKEAEPLLTEALWRLNDQGADLELLRARCLRDRGELEKATARLSRARQTDPNSARILRELISLRQQTIEASEFDEEKEAERKLLQSDAESLAALAPEDRNAKLLLSRLLFETSDPVFDAAKLERAESIAANLSKSSEFGDTEAIALLTRIQLKRKQLEEAEETLQKGLEKNPNSSLLAKTKQQIAIEKQVAELEREEEETEIQ